MNNKIEDTVTEVKETTVNAATQVKDVLVAACLLYTSLIAFHCVTDEIVSRFILINLRKAG